jgi:hypothetical protein
VKQVGGETQLPLEKLQESSRSRLLELKLGLKGPDQSAQAICAESRTCDGILEPVAEECSSMEQLATEEPLENSWSRPPELMRSAPATENADRSIGHSRSPNDGTLRAVEAVTGGVEVASASGQVGIKAEMAEKGVYLLTELISADVGGMGQPLGQETQALFLTDLADNSQLVAGDLKWTDKGSGTLA